MSHCETVGNVHISEEVVSKIAAVSAAEIEGVFCLEKNVGKELMGKLKKKWFVPGVRIDFHVDGIVIDLYLVVKYGRPFRSVAAAVHKNVKEAVESMSGYTVDCVNVHVVGVEFSDAARA
ncbi:MAG: Asp23/Gls24 family envelope stress response protein [Clostridia bacterium]|nr:Asp23/Gls24 family envelope stress response protein [Clostridia bacterium]